MTTGAGFAAPIITWMYQGAVAASGSMYVYQTGTTTLVSIYSDAGLTTPLSNPLNLDSNGQAVFYVSGSVNLRLDGYTGLAGAGTLIKSIDPVYPVGTASGFTTEATLASATTTDLGTASSSLIDITGTTTITGFGSSATLTAPLFFLRFTGALTLTYNATKMILPGSANITTAAGDTCVAQYMGSGNWKVLSYSPISGKAVVSSTSIAVTRIQTFTASGTYTPNANMLYCTIECWGGGGAGGGATAAAGACGGGGGSGSYSKKTASTATIGASQTVTIGAAGAGGASTGGAGGDTSIGTICVGKGGSGGAQGTTSATVVGGAGGVAGTGDITTVGDHGGIGFGQIASGEYSGGGGSTSLMGAGWGQFYTSEAAGIAAAANSGSGGGGAASNGTAHNGGNGGSGFVYITEYCSA